MNLPTALTFSVQTVLLLIVSNVFIAFVWYFAALASWGIALFEYLLQVSGNRIDFRQGSFSLAQLKIVPEVTTLSVFAPFAMVYRDELFKLAFVWAGLCMVGAVHFIFRTG